MRHSRMRLTLLDNAQAGLEDRAGSNGVLQCRQAHLVEVLERLATVFECLDTVDELLEAHVAVTSLAGEVAFLVGGVFHVL